jgi:hypothetical protein
MDRGQTKSGSYDSIDNLLRSLSPSACATTGWINRGFFFFPFQFSELEKSDLHPQYIYDSSFCCSSSNLSKTAKQSRLEISVRQRISSFSIWCICRVMAVESAEHRRIRKKMMSAEVEYPMAL